MAQEWDKKQNATAGIFCWNACKQARSASYQLPVSNGARVAVELGKGVFRAATQRQKKTSQVALTKLARQGTARIYLQQMKGLPDNERQWSPVD